MKLHERKLRNSLYRCDRSPFILNNVDYIIVYTLYSLTEHCSCRRDNIRFILTTVPIGYVLML